MARPTTPFETNLFNLLIVWASFSKAIDDGNISNAPSYVPDMTDLVESCWANLDPPDYY